MSDLIIVGDEAWTREEYEAQQRKRRKRHASSRYQEYQRQWRERNRDELRAYKREWTRRKRSDPEYREREREQQRAAYRRTRPAHPHLVGSLHDLACTGPTIATGCVCKKIRCYRMERAA